jgi:hypothetical protein
MICCSYYLLIFSSTKSENKKEEQVLPRNEVQGERKEVTQTMYTHVSKCKNDKIKGEKKITLTINHINMHTVSLVNSKARRIKQKSSHFSFIIESSYSLLAVYVENYLFMM